MMAPARESNAPVKLRTHETNLSVGARPWAWSCILSSILYLPSSILAAPSVCRIAKENAFTCLDHVAFLDCDMQTAVARDDQLRPRAELDHPKLRSCRELIPGFDPADDAAGNEPGDLTHDYPAIR